MSLLQRLNLYKELEKLRKRPLVVYMTSTRPGVTAMIASDAVGEVLAQLEALPPGTEALDLFIVSYGGDPTVAWRIASLIRERVKKFSVLIPQAAFSAATLLALGADELVMHPHGNLGPTDPQIKSRKNTKDGPAQEQQFGSQDLAAFLKFAREEVGLTDQANLLEVLKQFCEQVGPVPIGVAARSSQLSESMGEKLLKLHMTGETEKQKAHSISQSLNRSFFHHGYPVSRSEAKEIGLKLASPNVDIEKLMWAIWLDLEDEFKLREPFNPLALLRNDPQCQALFSPVPMLNLPGGVPPQALNQFLSQLLPQLVTAVPPTRYEILGAILESTRLATRTITGGSVLATRLPDLQVKLQLLADTQGWIDMDLQTGQPKPKTPAQAPSTLPQSPQTAAPAQMPAPAVATATTPVSTLVTMPTHVTAPGPADAENPASPQNQSSSAQSGAGEKKAGS